MSSDFPVRQLPPPPSSRSLATQRSSALSTIPKIYKPQPSGVLEPLQFKNAATNVSFEFPYQPDMTLKVAYKGEKDELKTCFYPVLWAMIPAINGLSPQIRLESSDSVDVPWHHLDKELRMTHATFGLVTEGWPDKAFRDLWMKDLVPAIEKIVQAEFNLPNFVVRDVSFFIDAVLKPADMIRFGGKAFNVTELIELFLKEEFEFTFRDETISTVTIVGVEQHLLHIWMQEARERGIDSRALNLSMKKTLDTLHDMIMRRQIPIEERLGDTERGKVEISRCRGGITAYSGKRDDSKKTLNCYVGLRYTRQFEHTAKYPLFQQATHDQAIIALNAISFGRTKVSRSHRADLAFPTTERRIKSRPKHGTGSSKEIEQ